MLIRKEDVPELNAGEKKRMCKAFKKKSAEERKKEMSELMAKLEEGVKGVFDSTEYIQYLRTMSKFRHYSLNNQLLIWCQCPHATAVAGFNDWKKKFGRSVKKGERGIKILAPMPIKIKAEEEQTDENGITHHTDEGIERIITLYKTVSVFDVSQTEGEPLPEFEISELDGKVHDYASILEAVIQAAPCNVYFEEIINGSKGYYSVIADKIVVNTGMSEEQTLKTLLHETAHAILHNKEHSKEGKDKPTKEVEAESIAFLVADYLGVDASSYTFKYVASWSAGKTVPELKASLETIKDTATELIDRVEKLLSGVTFSSEKGGSTSSNEGGIAVCVD